jgi:hypothetical protein
MFGCYPVCGENGPKAHFYFRLYNPILHFCAAKIEVLNNVGALICSSVKAHFHFKEAQEKCL